MDLLKTLLVNVNFSKIRKSPSKLAGAIIVSILATVFGESILDFLNRSECIELEGIKTSEAKCSDAKLATLAKEERATRSLLRAGFSSLNEAIDDAANNARELKSLWLSIDSYGASEEEIIIDLEQFISELRADSDKLETDMIEGLSPDTTDIRLSVLVDGVSGVVEYVRNEIELLKINSKISALVLEVQTQEPTAKITVVNPASDIDPTIKWERNAIPADHELWVVAFTPFLEPLTPLQATANIERTSAMLPRGSVSDGTALGIVMVTMDDHTIMMAQWESNQIRASTKSFSTRGALVGSREPLRLEDSYLVLDRVTLKQVADPAYRQPLREPNLSEFDSPEAYDLALQYYRENHFINFAPPYLYELIR